MPTGALPIVIQITHCPAPAIMASGCESISDRKRSKQSSASGTYLAGCGDTAGGEQFTVDFVHGHAECSDKTYRAIVAACLAAMVDEVGGCLVL